LKRASTGELAFHPATDPLGHTAPLDYVAWFPLLGLPLEIRSNSPAVLAAAERSFGQWRKLEPELVESSEPLVVSIIVHPPDVSDRSLKRRTQNSELKTQNSRLKTHFTQRVHGDCFIAASGDNLLTARMDHGQALAFVTPDLVADDMQFRHHVLECLALLLASWRDRTPIHAGAVVHDGRAALLVGPSTAGKSTLCYACARASFTLLAEDVVYVSLRDRPRLWGIPWRIHLLPDAPQLFPELSELRPQIQANGKRKLTVELAELGAAQPHIEADRSIICLIDRHSRRTSALAPIDPQAAIAALSLNLEAGFDLHSRAGVVAEMIARQGAYQLQVGNDLEGAVKLLRDLLGTSTQQQV
jgi:hypothetical protein